MRAGYHHGDLRQALIDAAEAVLAEKGVGGFTLRECARRAGVSPAAPAHHFGNLTGLLTAIATLGFDGLSGAMDAAAEAATQAGGSRLRAIGEAYLATALARPGRFRVVFGQMGLNGEDPDFKQASARAFSILVRETRAELPQDQGEDDLFSRLPPSFAGDPDLAEILLVWSVTHGFTTLLLDGQLDFLAGTAGREALLKLHSERLVVLLISALRSSDPSA
ncbi:TetR/AcrR family transcriptional regulator [Bosea caraganae]|uniref:TetR/AcrR family transcriptional regulator n=1 Tax=Bosea caraganae TaxID=2763117 RepID=UPI0015F0A370|nr:TetR/AcrR family transcriptional regulator [Bosea caraganae]